MRAQEDGRDAEGDILPALGRGAGHDGQCRVHEDHLEQEQNHHADVIGGAGEEESLGAPKAPVVSQQVNGEFMVERIDATQHGSAGGAAHLDGDIRIPSRRTGRSHKP